MPRFPIAMLFSCSLVAAVLVTSGCRAVKPLVFAENGATNENATSSAAESSLSLAEARSGDHRSSGRPEVGSGGGDELRDYFEFAEYRSDESEPGAM